MGELRGLVRLEEREGAEATLSVRGLEWGEASVLQHADPRGQCGPRFKSWIH